MAVLEFVDSLGLNLRNRSLKGERRELTFALPNGRQGVCMCAWCVSVWVCPSAWSVCLCVSMCVSACACVWVRARVRAHSMRRLRTRQHARTLARRARMGATAMLCSSNAHSLLFLKPPHRSIDKDSDSHTTEVKTASDRRPARPTFLLATRLPEHESGQSIAQSPPDCFAWCVCVGGSGGG
jgi:hypothetical protein